MQTDIGSSALSDALSDEYIVAIYTYITDSQQ